MFMRDMTHRMPRFFARFTEWLKTLPFRKKSRPLDTAESTCPEKATKAAVMEKWKPHEKARARPHRFTAEVIGHPPELLAANMNDYNPQMQSLLYGKLPPELREMVFSAVFAGPTLGFYTDPRDSRAQSETRMHWYFWGELDQMYSDGHAPWKEPEKSESSQEKLKAAAALVATCRRVFIDTKNLIFSRNWIFPRNIIALHKLQRCIPASSFNAITHLRICGWRYWPQFCERERSAMRMFRQYPTLQLYIVRNLPQVKHLEIVYSEVCGFAWWLRVNEELNNSSTSECKHYFAVKEAEQIRRWFEPPQEGTLKSYSFCLPLTALWCANYVSNRELGAYLLIRNGERGQYVDKDFVPYSADYVKKSIDRANLWLVHNRVLF